MDRLPQEALLEIARNLSRKELVRWAATSRRWCEWARKECMFIKLRLYFWSGSDEEISKSKMGKLIELAKKNNYGRKTRHLCIYGSGLRVDTLLKVVEAFPNIEELTWFIHDGPKGEDLESVLCKWKYLKKINEATDTNFTSSFLFPSPIAALLKSVSLQYDGYHLFDSDIAPSTNDFHLDVSNLKNAPNLQTLTIDTACITRDDLFSIHDALPHLKSLTFGNPECDRVENATFYPKDNDDSVSKKVENLDHLSIDDRIADYANDEIYLESEVEYIAPEKQFFIEANSWMKFISETYTDLESFHFFIYPCDDTRSNAEEARGYLRTALTNWKRLKSFGCSLCPLDKELLDIMEGNGVRLQKLTLYIAKEYERTSEDNLFILLEQYEEMMRGIRSFCVQHETWSGFAADHLLEELMFGYMPNIETLKLQAYKEFTGLSPHIIVKALNKLHKLKFLEADVDALEACGGLYGDISHPTQLIEFKVRLLVNESMRGALRLLGEIIQMLDKHCPMLQKFRAEIVDSTPKRAGRREWVFHKDIRVVFPFKNLLHLRDVYIHMPCINAYFEISVHHRASRGRKEHIEKFFGEPDEDAEGAVGRVIISVHQGTNIHVESKHNHEYLDTTL